jgi:hypothetical protein
MSDFWVPFAGVVVGFALVVILQAISEGLQYIRESHQRAWQQEREDAALRRERFAELAQGYRSLWQALNQYWWMLRGWTMNDDRGRQQVSNTLEANRLAAEACALDLVARLDAVDLTNLCHPPRGLHCNPGWMSCTISLLGCWL